MAILMYSNLHGRIIRGVLAFQGGGGCHGRLYILGAQDMAIVAQGIGQPHSGRPLHRPGTVGFAGGDFLRGQRSGGYGQPFQGTELDLALLPGFWPSSGYRSQLSQPPFEGQMADSRCKRDLRRRCVLLLSHFWPPAQGCGAEGGVLVGRSGAERWLYGFFHILPGFEPYRYRLCFFCVACD